MYLTRLTLHGFKSFANKTEFAFLPPTGGKQSITAIVGPNGSGKSNVSDAIRWVMGEQSMKKLRGKKSGDIIFGGSSGRGAMGMAAVSLILDNRDHLFPLPYDEVTIARQVYREGESEFLVNEQQVRLLDLQIMLAKAQFGNGSYSVVGQGMIDQMLLQTAEERKDFFDEAVGIKEFQMKRHQAMLKLTRSQEHMREASAILEEMMPHLRLLSRQTKKLEQRQEVEKRLRDLQESYYHTILCCQEEELRKATELFHEVRHASEEKRQDLNRGQEELSRSLHEPSSAEVFGKLQGEYAAAVRGKQEKESERAVLLGRLQSTYSEAGKRNVGWLQKKIAEIQGEKLLLTHELEKAEGVLTAREKEIVEQEERRQSAELAKTEMRGRLQALQQRLLDHKESSASFQGRGLSAIQALLDPSVGISGIFGMVAEIGKVKESHILALDVAAGTHLSSLVVKDDKVAADCIAFLREERLGIATFLPLNKIQPRPTPQDFSFLAREHGVVGPALSLVSFDKQFWTIFSYVFGSTLIMEDIEAARRIGIGRVRMVTLAGDVFERSGSMKGGWRKGERFPVSFGRGGRQTFQNEEALLTDMKKKEEELRAAERQYEETAEQLRTFRSSIEIQEGKANLLRERLIGLKREEAECAQELSLIALSPAEYTSAMKELEKQKAVLEKELHLTEQRVVETERALSAFHAREEEKRQRIFQLQEEMQAIQRSLNDLIEQKNRHEVERAKIETRQEDIHQEIMNELGVTPESLFRRGVPIASLSELSTIQDEIQKSKYALSLIGGIDPEVVAEYEQTKKRNDELSLQIEDLTKTVEDIEKLIIELDEMMKKKRETMFRAIRKEFERYFRILFGGGSADLIEVYGREGEENEETNGEEQEEREEKRHKGKKMLVGIEVKANPPGKKIANLAALSGGERTLTSLALVSAILRTNPSPFVVLDEVEAALDEANSVRFTDILEDLRAQSQFILITHNRATMHAADALYGVTMGGDGISKLVSVKVEGTT